MDRRIFLQGGVSITCTMMTLPGVAYAGPVVSHERRVLALGTGACRAANALIEHGLQPDRIVALDVHGENSEWIPLPSGGSFTRAPALDGFREELEGAKKPIVVACLGGVTGSRAAERIARSGPRDLRMIVTLPFTFEGAHRRRRALSALSTVQRFSSRMSVLDYDCLRLAKRSTFTEAFARVDAVLARAISDALAVSA